MGLFNKTPEELAASEQKKREKAERLDIEKREVAQRIEAEKFARSPAGHAKAARDAGAKIFQLSLPLSETTGHTAAMLRAYVETTTNEHASVLDAIEGQGWRLEHASYVYRVTGSVSRDKFLSSGQQEAVHGEIVGVYIFRARE